MMKTARNPGDPAKEKTEFRQALEAYGCRLTRQRVAIFDYLCSVHTHPTAEEVYSAVRERLPNISLATVYKSLEALVTCKLAGKLTSGDGPARYDCRSDNHYHIRCLETGQVRDLPTPHDPDLIQKLDPSLLSELCRQGFEVTGYRLEILGRFTKDAALS